MATHGLSKRRLAMGEEAWAKHKRQQSVRKIVKFRQKRKLRLIEYLGGCCSKCGYNRCPAALDIHHKDPEAKELKFANNLGMSWKRLKTEADKCVLLCKNCHAELHFEHERQKEKVKRMMPISDSKQKVLQIDITKDLRQAKIGSIEAQMGGGSVVGSPESQIGEEFSSAVIEVNGKKKFFISQGC